MTQIPMHTTPFLAMPGAVPPGQGAAAADAAAFVAQMDLLGPEADTVAPAGRAGPVARLRADNATDSDMATVAAPPFAPILLQLPQVDGANGQGQTAVPTRSSPMPESELTPFVKTVAPASSPVLPEDSVLPGGGTQTNIAKAGGEDQLRIAPPVVLPGVSFSEDAKQTSLGGGSDSEAETVPLGAVAPTPAGKSASVTSGTGQGGAMAPPPEILIRGEAAGPVVTPLEVAVPEQEPGPGANAERVRPPGPEQVAAAIALPPAARPDLAPPALSPLSPLAPVASVTASDLPGPVEPMPRPPASRPPAAALPHSFPGPQATVAPLRADPLSPVGPIDDPARTGPRIVPPDVALADAQSLALAIRPAGAERAFVQGHAGAGGEWLLRAVWPGMSGHADALALSMAGGQASQNLPEAATSAPLITGPESEETDPNRSATVRAEVAGPISATRAMPEPGLGLPVPSLPATPPSPAAPSPPLPLHMMAVQPPRSDTARPDANSAAPVPLQIVQAVSAGGPVTELRLSPEELGLVRIDMRHEGERLVMAVSAERQETLELLRRHAGELTADLRTAGHAGVDLSFGRWSGPGGQALPAPLAASSPEQRPLPDETVVHQPTVPQPLPGTGLYLRI